jgi:hypothetical protein
MVDGWRVAGLDTVGAQASEESVSQHSRGEMAKVRSRRSCWSVNPKNFVAKGWALTWYREERHWTR